MANEFTPLSSYLSLLAELIGQYSNRHQSALGLSIPRHPAIEPNTIIELIRIAENDAWRNANALLQRPEVEILRIDPGWKAHPENEAADRSAHLGSLWEVLLNGQLPSRHILAVLLPDGA